LQGKASFKRPADDLGNMREMGVQRLMRTA
jgi:hypothetical protein